jgi:HD domain
MSDVGTWAWAQRTGGAMSRRDRLHELRQGVLARLAALPARLRGPAARPAVSLDLPDPPDSALAREAEQCVRELSSPRLYGHCLRTWFFAAAFAELDKLDHEPELLYLACVLHDLGLTPVHDRRDPTAKCFAVEGARAAEELLIGKGAAQELAVSVAEAISLHLNVNVGEELGAEAHLLSKGVSLDAVGRRVDEIPARTIADAIERWPRDGFSAELAATTRRQAKLRPRSRSALLVRLGFAELVTGNPLDDTA